MSPEAFERCDAQHASDDVRQPDPPLSLYWCYEVELSTVSGLWHHPEFFELAHEELDFELHFTVPKHKILLRAIESIYSWSCNEGIPNYTSVVHLIREWGEFEECGGHQGINEVFDYAYYNAGYGDVILRWHIGLLKEYAIARKTDPFKPVRYFSGGRVRLRPNKVATNDKSPSVVGEGIWEGIKIRAAGWPTDTGEEISLKLERTR